jgi:hypothetical protein
LAPHMPHSEVPGRIGPENALLVIESYPSYRINSVLPGIASFVHFAHSTSAKERENLVRPNRVWGAGGIGIHQLYPRGERTDCLRIARLDRIVAIKISSERFSERFVRSTGATPYDVAPDGKRVVAATHGGATPQNSGRVIFLENFIDELQRKVPLRGK